MILDQDADVPQYVGSGLEVIVRELDRYREQSLRITLPAAEEGVNS